MINYYNLLSFFKSLQTFTCRKSNRYWVMNLRNTPQDHIKVEKRRNDYFGNVRFINFTKVPVCRSGQEEIGDTIFVIEWGGVRCFMTMKIINEREREREREREFIYPFYIVVSAAVRLIRIELFFVQRLTSRTSNLDINWIARII